MRAGGLFPIERWGFHPPEAQGRHVGLVFTRAVVQLGARLRAIRYSPRPLSSTQTARGYDRPRTHAAQRGRCSASPPAPLHHQQQHNRAGFLPGAFARPGRCGLHRRSGHQQQVGATTTNVGSQCGARVRGSRATVRYVQVRKKYHMVHLHRKKFHTPRRTL